MKRVPEALIREIDFTRKDTQRLVFHRAKSSSWYFQWIPHCVGNTNLNATKAAAGHWQRISWSWANRISEPCKKCYP